MSIEDDEYDLDDDILGGAFEEDFEDDFDDFDEDDDENISFDEEEVLFDEDDDELVDSSSAESMGAEKKKFSLDIGFDKIAIIGALIVGVIILVFQVTTKTAEQKVEVFRSVLTMKGATDGEVFGESKSKDITTVPPTSQEDQKAFLYEPEALNQLPDNLKDGVIVQDVDIAPVENPQPVKKESRFVSNLPSASDSQQSGEFVSITGEVVKDQMDFIPEQKQEKTSFEEEIKELQSTQEEKTIVQKQPEKPNTAKDLNFVPIENVIEEPKKQKPKEVKIDPTQAVALEKQKQETQQLQSEMALLRGELNQLRREKEKLEGAMMQEKQARMEAEESKKRAEDERQRIERAILLAKKKAEKQTKAITTKAVAPPQVKDNAKPPAIIWELRGAQPGKAWISQKGKQDIVSVEIGKTVEGIGKITSIAIKDGKWVVAGTQGKIHQ